jgi:hypothetical protein
MDKPKQWILYATDGTRYRLPHTYSSKEFFDLLNYCKTNYNWFIPVEYGRLVNLNHIELIAQEEVDE